MRVAQFAASLLLSNATVREDGEDEDEVSDEYRIVNWFHFSFFSVLFVVASVQLYRIAVNVGSFFSQDAISQKVYHGLLLSSFLMRSVFFALEPFQSDGDTDAPETLMFFLNMMPAFLYYSAYTILILYWAETYHNTVQSYSSDYDAPETYDPADQSSCFKFIRDSRFKSSVIFVKVNAILYFIYVVQLVLFASLPDDRDVLWNITLTFSASVCLLTAVGFLVYGHRQYNMLGQLPVKSGFRSSQLHKVLWVTIICTTCFSIRALLIIWSALIDPLTSNWGVVFSFYFFLEQVPACLMLFLLRKMPRNASSLIPNGPYPN